MTHYFWISFLFLLLASYTSHGIALFITNLFLWMQTEQNKHTYSDMEKSNIKNKMIAGSIIAFTGGVCLILVWKMIP